MKAELLSLFPFLGTPWGAALAIIILLGVALVLLHAVHEIRAIKRRAKWIKDRTAAREYFRQAEEEWHRRYERDSES